jgi:hypothetical protein
MTAAERASAPLLPNLPVRRPDAPGQFAFSDPRRIESILQESGWIGIDIQAVDIACTFPENAIVDYLTRFGPVGRVLEDADEQARTRVIKAARLAFEPYVEGSDVRFVAACWLVNARTPAPRR